MTQGRTQFYIEINVPILSENLQLGKYNVPIRRKQ